MSTAKDAIFEDLECCDDPQCESCGTCREHCQCWHDDDVWHRA